MRIVARDRSQADAAGFAAGASGVIEIADQWHLASNPVAAVEAPLAKHPDHLLGGSFQVQAATAAHDAPSDGNRKQTAQEEMLPARRAKRAS